MQFQCDDIWRRVDQLDFRFGDELTSRPRRRDDQGDELTCNRLAPGQNCYAHSSLGLVPVLELGYCASL